MIIPKDGLQIKPQILISASIELLIHLYDMKNHTRDTLTKKLKEMLL